MDDHSSHGDLAETHVRVVLDYISPTVVVRRRSGEASPSARADLARREAIAAAASAPAPSRARVAYVAPESTRTPHLRPVKAFVTAEAEAPAPPVSEVPKAAESGIQLAGTEEAEETVAAEEAPSAPAKLVVVDKQITVTKLAAEMNVSASDLVSELVCRGFFEVSAKANVSREIAEIGARAFGWQISAPTPKVATRRAAAKRAGTTKTPRAKRPARSTERFAA